MAYRYTMEDLKKSDRWMLMKIIYDRKSTCTNINSPLYKRLNELEDKIYNKRRLTGDSDG